MTADLQMSEPAVLDVRRIIPRERHPLIFQLLDRLAPGQTLVIVNDHDPIPLYYQIQATRLQQYGWRYLESGPEIWRVEISRNAIPDQDQERIALAHQTVNAIVECYPQTIPVLKSFGIDLCCGGSLTLARVAEEHGLDLNTLLASLQPLMRA